MMEACLRIRSDAMLYLSRQAVRMMNEAVADGTDGFLINHNVGKLSFHGFQTCELRRRFQLTSDGSRENLCHERSSSVSIVLM